MKKFNLYLDNGGILILITFDGDKADYVHTYQMGDLKDLAWCLNDLRRPDCSPAEDWDGNEIDDIDVDDLLQMIDDDRVQGNCNFELLADEDGLYPKNTGNAMVKNMLRYVDARN